jgi:hypothetical protein
MDSNMRHAAMLCGYLLALAFSSITAASGAVLQPKGIGVGPENLAVNLGSAAVLRCRSDDAPSSNIRWYEYITNPEGDIISDGETVIPGHPNSARYTIVHPDAVTFDLQINPTVWNDAGLYACVDSDVVPPSTGRLNVQLVIIEAAPNCTSQVPDDGFVIEGFYRTVECQVQYKASPGIAPLMTWSGPQPFQSVYRSTNNSVWSAVEFIVQRSMEARNFQCRTNFTTEGFIAPDSASNAPTWRHTYADNQMVVLWTPTNMTAYPLQASYEIGDRVTCWADANPTATYQWQSLATNEIWTNESFVTRPDMVGFQTMRCTARNTIMDKDYTQDLFIDVYVNPKTTTPVPTTPPSTTPVAAISPCSDLTGRWQSSGPAATVCLTVDHANDARLVGLFLKGSDTYWLQLTGRTREGAYDESGWAIIWATSPYGVSSYAAECHRCYGVEIMTANAISRSTNSSELCSTGVGNAQLSPQYTFRRVPTSWPCSSSLAETLRNMERAELGRLRQASRLI